MLVRVFAQHTRLIMPCVWCRLRLVSLAAQRFVASALHDAKQVYSRRQKQTPARLKEAGYDIKDKRPVLLAEDLAEAMSEVIVLLVMVSGLYETKQVHIFSCLITLARCFNLFLGMKLVF